MRGGEGKSKGEGGRLRGDERPRPQQKERGKKHNRRSGKVG